MNNPADLELARAELARAKQRITELHEIIVGDRPDKFYDSLIRGSRVSRMEDCISTFKAICEYIDVHGSNNNSYAMLEHIHKLATNVIDANPDFGMFPIRENKDE